MSERNDRLKELISKGLTEQAIQEVQGTREYGEGAFLVVTVLESEQSDPSLVEATLEAFLKTKPDHKSHRTYGGGHDGWVHSLSHFTEKLWKRRMDDWIKKFNEVAFKGANELGDTGCSNRLVQDFGRYARFDEDPADFHLTPENLRWMEEKDSYSMARVVAGRFESEEAFLRWNLRRPSMYASFNYKAQTQLVNLEGIRHFMQRLRELGADTSEFDGLEKDLLTKRLNELEQELPEAKEDWQRERLEKGIQITRAALTES